MQEEYGKMYEVVRSNYTEEELLRLNSKPETARTLSAGNKSMYYVNTEDTSGGSIHDVLKNLQAVEDEACEGCTL